MYFTEVLREETDKEIIEPKNWVCEMYGYMLASADNKLVHHYPPNFSAAPPFDVSMTYCFFFFPISLLPLFNSFFFIVFRENDTATILHYAYAIDHSRQGFYFDKKLFFTDVPYPRPYPSPPEIASISTKVLIEKLNFYLIRAFGNRTELNPRLLEIQNDLEREKTKFPQLPANTPVE